MGEFSAVRNAGGSGVCNSLFHGRTLVLKALSGRDSGGGTAMGHDGRGRAGTDRVYVLGKGCASSVFYNIVNDGKASFLPDDLPAWGDLVTV